MTSKTQQTYKKILFFITLIIFILVFMKQITHTPTIRTPHTLLNNNNVYYTHQSKEIVIDIYNTTIKKKLKLN